MGSFHCIPADYSRMEYDEKIDDKPIRNILKFKSNED